MITTEKRGLTLLMVFHTLWGLVLWLSISKYGPGISTDSVHLLFGALNLSEGRGLASFDGSFLLFWPPLYPALLALIRILSGSNPFVSATILQFTSFAGMSFCLSAMFLRIFPQRFWLAFAANFLSDIGAVVLAGFGTVGSDYVHLLLVVVFAWLAGYYIESNSPRLLLAMSILGMLAMLQRYLGIAVIATGVTLICLFTRGDLNRRIGRSFLMGLAALPAGLWLLVTSKWITPREPIGLVENSTWFSKSVLEWFLPPEAVEPYLIPLIACLWILTGGLIMGFILLSRRYKAPIPHVVPILIYGFFYVLALFGSASLEYFNKLAGRFLLPLYIPFVTLLVSAAGLVLQRARDVTATAWRRVISVGTVGALTLAAVGLAGTTVPLVLRSRLDGAPGENAFNTRVWHESSAMNYWLTHQPPEGYLLFSNAPDGIAFYTWHPCLASPRQYDGPYSQVEIPQARYVPELFSSGRDVYLVWIEPGADTYYYRIEELTSIANIQTLYVGRDGGVYRLRPLTGASP
jgi:hypothetical protein